MAFTHHNHTVAAVTVLLFIPALFLAQLLNPTAFLTTVLVSSIQTANMLPHDNKIDLLHNHSLAITAAAASNSTPHMLTHPIVLHFTPVPVDAHALAVLFGLLASSYSILSLRLSEHQSHELLPSSYDASSPAASTDTAIVICDNLFWLVFLVYHAHHILSIIVIATLDYIFLFIFASFSFTWVLANRILLRYPPALVCATFALFAVHITLIADLLQRHPDLWIPHFLLIIYDAMLVLCHTIDDVLTSQTALNCRISYILLAALSTLAIHVFGSSANAVLH
jgi:hypothetical protein